MNSAMNLNVQNAAATGSEQQPLTSARSFNPDQQHGHPSPSAASMSAVPDACTKDMIIKLQMEVRDLRTYSDKVTKELRRYQLANKPQVSEAELESMAPLPQWASDMRLMAPLLVAYEDRIRDLEEVVDKSMSMIDPTEQLVKENNQLRADLQEKVEQIRNNNAGGPRPYDAGTAGDEEARNELAHLYQFTSEQNDVLLHQNQLLKQQLDKMGDTVKKMQMKSAQDSHRAEECSKAAGLANAKVSGLIAEREFAEKRLLESVSELNQERRECLDLKTRMEATQADQAVCQRNADMYKKSLEERTSKATEDGQAMNLQLERMQKEDKDHRSKVAALERQVNDLNNALRNAKKEAEVVQTEAQNWLGIMETMERQQKELREKNEASEVALTRAQNDMDEMLLDRDKALASAEASAKTVERNEIRAKEELAAEKEALEEAHQHTVDHLRKTEAELEKQLRGLETNHGNLAADLEQTRRGKNNEIQALERKVQLLAKERQQIDADFAELQQRRLHAERKADDALADRQKLDTDLRSTIDDLERRCEMSSGELAATASQNKLLTDANNKSQAEWRSMTVELDESRTTVGRLHDDLQKNEKMAASDSDEIRTRHSNAMSVLENQLRTMQERLQAEERRRQEDNAHAEVVRRHLTSQFDEERRMLKVTNSKLQKESKVLKEKKKALLKVVALQQLEGDIPAITDANPN